MTDEGQSEAKRDSFQRITSQPDCHAQAPMPPHPHPADAGLSIVIPTYNALGTVEPLLRQLAALPEVQSGLYEVVITDDVSTDGTVAALRKQYPHFCYVESAENTGFGLNCNRGIAAASKGYTALVNTDIELVGNPFAELTAQLHAHPTYFALMPLIYNTALGKVENLQRLKVTYSLPWNEDLPGADGQPAHVQFSGPITAKFEGGAELADLRPELAGLMAPSSMRIINSILCGACFVCATERLRQLGGFDPRFSPCYWEDVDLGQRAWEASDHSFVGTVTSCLVVHRHSETINRAHGDRKMQFLRLNQLRYSLAHLRPDDPPQKGERGYETEEAARRQTALRKYKSDMWWRGVRERFRGDQILCRAYFLAAAGEVRV